MEQARFVRTDSILDKILESKVQEIDARKQSVPQQRFEEAVNMVTPPRGLLSALRQDASIVALIAEVKHASPSKGVLIEPFDPVVLGRTYAKYGAAAISVLTDEPFFLGSLEDMRKVRTAVEVPVLRKDFILDPYQIYEARAAGADAILLIVAALGDAQLADLHTLTKRLGMAALVEVHDEKELERALRINAPLIGINNRNLKTFKVSMDVTVRLARLVPPSVTLVAESGIRDSPDVRDMGAAGAHAVLVGEALVQARERARMVKRMSRQRRLVKR
ncbi:MAG: indole-3-glycerol phosphate synthase TrpC [Chloroflexi bacterium]|nr:MAG: indole-3-glycerol phosphate synthase TrpC [Chloroflexota bacterium]